MKAILFASSPNSDIPVEIAVKNNLSGAAGAPTVNDDSADGYEVGSLWVYGGNAYVCVSAAVGAAVWNLMGVSGLSPTELALLDGATAGTVVAGKAIAVDANKGLIWGIAAAGTGTVTPLDFDLVASGVGAEVDGAKFTTSTEVALGTYANAINGKLDFGTAGKVSGLGGAICAEVDLGPGLLDGSYACFEAELNCPASGLLGARTSFLSLNAWGANVAAIDAGAFLFDLNGLTAGATNLIAAGTTAGTLAGSLKVNILGVARYINFYDAAAH